MLNQALKIRPVPKDLVEEANYALKFISCSPVPRVALAVSWKSNENMGLFLNTGPQSWMSRAPHNSSEMKQASRQCQWTSL
eukprot:6830996-Lingulodinium_polyedra.AAC.1